MERAGATTAPELLDRERELGAIEARIDAIAEGDGSLLMIQGPAGIGKTALLAAAEPMAAAVGAEFIQARGGELEHRLSFGVVRQLFERRIATASAGDREALFAGAAALAEPAIAAGRDPGDFAAGDDPAGAIQHGLYWLAANLCERRPLVLAVDDLHWADSPSTRWLLYLSRRLANLPLLLLLATRPTDAGENAPLIAALAGEPVSTTLEPSELGEKAAVWLVRARLGPDASARFAEACRRASGGNPFLLGELVDAIARDRILPDDESVQRIEELAPESITRSVLLRIAGMPSGSDRLARAVAILGSRADLSSAAVLSELDRDEAAACADALAAGSLLALGDELRFVHPLLRAAVYEQIPPGERALAHRRAAELLTATGAGAEEVATHLLRAEAGASDADVDLLRRAATAALGRGAPNAAVTYMRRTFDVAAPDLRPELLAELAHAAWRAYDIGAFEGISKDPVGELEGYPEKLRQAQVQLGAWLYMSGRMEESRALAARGIEAERAAGNVERALEYEIGLLAIFNTPGTTPERLLHGMRAWWLHFDRGHAAAAVELAERALEGGTLIEEMPDLPAAGQSILVLVRADELDLAEAFVDAMDDDARRRGSVGAHAMASGLRSQVALRRGDVAGAVEEARIAVAINRERGVAAVILPLLTAWLIEALIESGELEAAGAELATSGIAGEIGGHFWLVPPRFARARLRVAEGSRPEAIADLRVLMGQPTPLDYDVDSTLALLLAAEGKIAEAEQLADAGVARARDWGTPTAIGVALRARGLVAGGEGGIGLLEEAVRALEASPNRLEHARALTDLGAALRRAKRRREAREPLAAAVEMAHRCGARAIEQRAGEELAATGARPRRVMLSGVESLTASERRVARMAANGMENREIAQALFVTVKTVETHLTSVYRKLDISSRRDLPKVLERG